MPIDPETLETLRRQTDLAALVAEHTPLKRRGSRLYGLCPFHQEDTPSFSVDPERSLFFCFGCQAGGDVFRFVMLASRLSFPEAVEYLARRAGIALKKREATRHGPAASITAALEAAAELFEIEIGKNPQAVRYLASRRIPPEIALAFGLGYTPSAWTGLRDALCPRFGSELLERAGLLLRSSRSSSLYDRFRDRIMIPLREPGGRLAGFAGRALTGAPPYLNSPDSGVFRKREILFGLPQAEAAIRSRGRVVLVEGYFDVLAFAAAGVEEVVSPMGTHLAPEQVRLLPAAARQVVLALDSDPAGREATRRMLSALLPSGRAVLSLELAEGHDPASLREAEGDGALLASLSRAKDALASELARIASSVPEGDTLAHAEAITRSLKLLELLPEAALRISYARLAGKLLDIPASSLLAALSQKPHSSRLR